MDNGVKVRQPGKKGNTPWQHRPSHPESRNIRKRKESSKGRQQNFKKNSFEIQSANLPVANCIYHAEYQKKDTI